MNAITHRRAALLTTASILALSFVLAPVTLDGDSGGVALQVAKANSCFVAGTMVLMADGGEKRIEEVAVGERVLGAGGAENWVTGIELTRLGPRLLHAFNDGPFFVTSEHPFMTTEGWKALDPGATEDENPSLHVGHLVPGDKLQTVRVEPAPRVSLGNLALAPDRGPEFEYVVLSTIASASADPDVALYNLLLDGDHSYFADGYLVHNKGGEGGGGEGGGGEGGGEGESGGGEGEGGGGEGESDGGGEGESESGGVGESGGIDAASDIEKLRLRLQTVESRRAKAESEQEQAEASVRSGAETDWWSRFLRDLGLGGPDNRSPEGKLREARAEVKAAREEIRVLRQRLAEMERDKLRQAATAGEASDTGLPLIKATVPRRVVVGESKRITGTVGDDGSPPRLRVNGETIPLFRPAPGEAPIGKYTLAFHIGLGTDEPGKREYLLEACDAAGNCVSERLEVDIIAVNRPSMAARNFALVIGNNEYRNLPDLATAVADATELAETLTSRYSFRPEDVKLLLNADRRTILGELEDMRRELGTEDRLLLYYAGHGQIDPVTQEGYWQPVDAEEDRQFTWIANDDVQRYLKGMPAKHVLVIADSCFSGSLARGVTDYGAIPRDRFYTEIDGPVSRKVISSGGTEPVSDSGTSHHSVFAYYLLKALRENDQPYIASFELFNNLVRAVTNNSNQKPQYGTVLEAGDEGAGDFTFILRPGG